jgi:DNA-binding CsgD family transcriptional regulator
MSRPSPESPGRGLDPALPASPDAPVPLTDHGAIEAESQRRQALLERAEELAGIGAWRLDLRTGEAEWSDGMYRIHGIGLGTVEPSVEMLLERTHADDRERLRILLEAVVGDPQTVSRDGVTGEYRAVLPDGSVRDVRFHGVVETGDDDECVAWTGIGQDVTDQRLTERELFVHYAVGQILSEAEAFDDGPVSLLRRIGTALGYPVGALWTFDDENERIVARAFWSAADVDVAEFEAVSRETALTAGQGVPGLVWATGQPVVAEELFERLEPARRQAAGRAGLVSGVAIPSFADGSPVGVITFYGFERPPGETRLTRLLAHLGRQLGPALARRRGAFERQPLTGRELEVLQLASAGVSGPQIAERLFIAPATVKTHFNNIYEKLGVGDRAGAVAHALRTGLIR